MIQSNNKHCFSKDDKHIKPWDHLYLRSVRKRRVEQHTIAMTWGSTLNSIGDVMVKLVIRPVSQLSSRKCSAFSSTSRLFSSAHLFWGSVGRNLRMKQSLVRHMPRKKQQTFLARGLLKILGTRSKIAMLWHMRKLHWKILHFYKRNNSTGLWNYGSGSTSSHIHIWIIFLSCKLKWNLHYKMIMMICL
jgi:hypothetical protein